MSLHDPFDDSKWELDNAIRVLKEADEIRKDVRLMAKVERRLKEQQVDLVNVEEQLFGKSEGQGDKLEAKEVG